MRVKWWYDDKVQMLLNTYFPRRKRFRAHWCTIDDMWKEGHNCSCLERKPGTEDDQ